MAKPMTTPTVPLVAQRAKYIISQVYGNEVNVRLRRLPSRRAHRGGPDDPQGS
jgi:hypothetical protein